jgi:hypothetical protein
MRTTVYTATCKISILSITVFTKREKEHHSHSPATSVKCPKLSGGKINRVLVDR